MLIANPSPTDREDQIAVEIAVPDEWPAVSLQLPDGRRVPTQERSRKHPFVFQIEMPGQEVVGWIRRRLYGREVYQHQWNSWRETTLDGIRTIVLEVDDEAHPVWLDVDTLLDGIAVATAAHPDERSRVRVVARARRTIVARVPDVPALGWTSATPVAAAPTEVIAAPVQVADDGRTLDNGLLRVTVEAGGTLTLSGRGATLRGVGRIVDGGDAGDSYNYAPPADDELVEHPDEVSVALSDAGDLVSRIAIDRRYRWPDAVTDDRRTREPATQETTIRTEVELRAGEPFARMRVAFDNRSRDHRVRFHVPVGAGIDRSFAEGQLGVVERSNIIEAGHGEYPVPTYPARGWVAAGQAAVLLDHVTEYELLAEGSSELAITVLRSVDRISRNDNPWRDEPAGPQTPIPEAQLLGPWSMGFAILPIADTWHRSGVQEAAERYQHAFLTSPGREIGGTDGDLGSAAGLRVTGRGIVLSALRRIGEALELRLVAEHPDPEPAGITGPFASAREVDLLGRPVVDLRVAGPGALELAIGPWEIRTIRLEPAR